MRFQFMMVAFLLAHSLSWHVGSCSRCVVHATTRPRGPRKDNVNVLRGQSVDLVFQADNPGRWMLRCHNAHHLESAMATVLTYRT